MKLHARARWHLACGCALRTASAAWEMRAMLRRIAFVAVIGIVTAVIAATAGTARAGMTLSLGQPDLQAGVLIVLPATVSCSPFDPSLTMASSSLFVSVEQAVSKTAIAHGSAFAPAMGDNPILYPCDDSPHTVTLNVLADVDGAPFRKGPAVFSASASAAAGIPCGPGCFTDFVFQNASLVTTLKLK
jgi:hypothetical protein